MGNFIADLDERYKKERKENKVKKGNKHFSCNIPLKVELYGYVFQDYIIRKAKYTKFLYIKDLANKIFTNDKKELKFYIEDIKDCLIRVFANSIEEKIGAPIDSCSIHAKLNVNGVYIAQIIGMSLYLFRAAGLIEIIKADDYEESRKVGIKRVMVTYQDDSKHYFYEKYSDCIGCAVDVQVK